MVEGVLRELWDMLEEEEEEKWYAQEVQMKTTAKGVVKIGPLNFMGMSMKAGPGYLS